METARVTIDCSNLEVTFYGSNRLTCAARFSRVAANVALGLGFDAIIATNEGSCCRVEMIDGPDDAGETIEVFSETIRRMFHPTGDPLNVALNSDEQVATVTVELR